jgi:hypothetical protein
MATPADGGDALIQQGIKHVLKRIFPGRNFGFWGSPFELPPDLFLDNLLDLIELHMFNKFRLGSRIDDHK